MAISAVGLQAEISIKIVPSQAPNDYGSPNWSAYAANAVNGLIHDTGTLGDPTTASSYTILDQIVNSVNLITTDFPSWMGSPSAGTVFAGELGNKLRFGVSIVSSSPTEKFRLSDVRVTLAGTDSQKWLDLDPTWVPASKQFDFSMVGLVYGSGGRGSIDDQWITSGGADQYVNAAFWVGAWTGIQVLDDGSGTSLAQQITNQAVSYLQDERDFNLSATYQLFDTNHLSVLQSSTKGMTVIPEPSTLMLLGGGLGMMAWGWRRQRRS